MTHTDQSRAEFESWQLNVCLLDLQELDIYANGNYGDDQIQAEWMAWQGARATTKQSSGVELPEPVAHINQNGVIHEAGYDWSSDNYLSGLYSEQQVRALLAGAHDARRDAQRQLETIQGELAKLERYQFMLNRGALVPPGFRSVPAEPTEDMFIDGMEASCVARPSIDDDSYVRSIWNAMLAAAPQPPKEQT